MKLFRLLSAGALLLGAVTLSNAQDNTMTTQQNNMQDTNVTDKTSNKKDMGISFGVKGGLNLSTVNGGSFDSPDYRVGFHAGVVVEFPIADIFSIQVEGLYSQQGYEISDYRDLGIGYPNPATPRPILGANDNPETEYQLDYINVPVLFKFYITEGFSAEAGPQFSFLVSEEYDNRPYEGSGDRNTDIFETFDVGATGGVTFQTPSGLFASGRYTQGITDILQNSNQKITNSVFQISVGYKF